MKEIYLIKKNVDNLLNGRYTFFLDLRKQKLVQNNINIKYNIYKPYADAEKVIFYINKKPEIILFEIKCNYNLKHSDILGAVFSLNIDEELFGDILVINNKYYIYLIRHMENYFITHLTMIKNYNITLEKTDEKLLENYEREYEVIEFISSSERLDSIISNIINSNREKAKDKIKNKEVLVNYEEKKIPYVLKKDDIISVRKFGKYKYIGKVNETKKGNFVIRIKKYM